MNYSKKKSQIKLDKFENNFRNVYNIKDIKRYEKKNVIPSS